MVVPFTRPYEYVKEFKQAHRRDDDIAIVNAGMRLRLAEGPGEAAAWVKGLQSHPPPHSFCFKPA